MPRIESLRVSAYTIPTERPESDGTLEWDSTTLILVRLGAGGKTGLGYTYAAPATARLIEGLLKPVVCGAEAMDIPRLYDAMRRGTRNLGGTGIAAMAISAIDTALWDLKAKLLELPLVRLLGSVRDSVPVYGSGGFTSYSDTELSEQLSNWATQGIRWVKMKVGRDPGRDPARVRAAREAIGAETRLFVDANSAYDRKQALGFMHLFADQSDVRWMEQPLAPEDLEGMRFLRENSPPHMEITDGEYAYGPADVRRMIESGAVDVVMADATRCCGITGFMRIGALCEAWRLPLSSHCAPLLHIHPGCALPAFRHAEYFHDHARIERMMFDGLPPLVDGTLMPDPDAPGLGFEFKEADAKPYLTTF
jgi:L-alanine-DL-glutamate epimerase-like enolase superfamily enzyme